MSNLSKTPIVDKNGKLTHVYKKGAAELSRTLPSPQPIVELPEGRAFPNGAVIGHGSSEEGNRIGIFAWTQRALPADIAELLSSPANSWTDEGNIKWDIAENRFEAVFGWSYENPKTEEFIRRLKEEAMSEFSDEASNLSTGEFGEFPDVLAVDPQGCGCTECIIGEYVNEGAWTERATATDVARLMSGDIRNNTSNSDFNSVFLASYSTQSASRFVSALEDSFDNFAHTLHLEALADEVRNWV